MNTRLLIEDYGKEILMDILASANKYVEQHDWKKAIEYFNLYMKDHTDYSDITYASFAKCLRNDGQLNHAENTLNEGHLIHPQSEKILQELFRLYNHLGSWKKAKSVAESLIELNPKKGAYFFKLGQVHSWLFNLEEAERNYRIGLECKHGIPFNQLIENIQSGLTEDTNQVTTTYKYVSGKNNLGVFLHDYRGEKFITKISKLNSSAKREEAFYRDVVERFPSIKHIVPKYVASQMIDDVQYLTIEMIDDTRKMGALRQIVDVSEQISSITYQDIVHAYPNPQTSFSFKSRTSSIVNFFTQIHRRYYNERLISSLEQFAERKNYPEASFRILRRMKALILENHLYAFIDPTIHYSLLHADFIPANMMVSNEGRLKVFDWADFKIGPHFIDIARYVTKTLIPYRDVKAYCKRLSTIELIFFLYAYISFLLVRLKKKKRSPEDIIAEFISPALGDLEYHVSQYKQEQFAHAVTSMIEDKRKMEWQSTQLKKEIKHLKSKNNKSHEKYQNILASKSWKLTEPLRRFIRLVKRVK